MNCGVRVILKFRPNNKREMKEKDDKKNCSLTIVNNKKVKVKTEAIEFDAVLGPESKQSESFEAVAEASCVDLLDGFNSTIFMYGQTGAGKTYTMYGDGTEKDVERMGIVPRSLSFIFESLAKQKEDGRLMEYSLKCAFLEIYNETLRDMLSNDPNSKPTIRAMKDMTFCDGLTEIECEDINQVLKLIAVANKNRVTASTKQNEVSSRGHMIMIVDLARTIREDDVSVVESAKMYFGDLAGSERQKKTNAKGTRLKEAQNINLSLTVLGRVINALAEPKKKQVIPYRESKLTHILKDSLGGNCKTTLCICGTVHHFNRDETITTIKFGQRCKKIQTKAKVNRVWTKAELLRKVDALEKANEDLMAMKLVGGKFDEAQMSRDSVLFGVKQELGDLTFEHTQLEKVASQVEELVGIERLKLIVDYSSNELVAAKCKELGKLINGMVAGHNRRASLLALIDIDMANQAGYLHDAAANVAKRKRRVDKKWCWLNESVKPAVGYKPYSETLSNYIDGMDKGEEENIRINNEIYLLTRAGKHRGHAVELRKKHRLDLRHVTLEKMEEMNKEIVGK